MNDSAVNAQTENVSMTVLSGKHLAPEERLLGLLRYNRSALIIVVCYTALSGLLSLAIPVTTQVLVNIIAAGILIQPLVVLTALLLSALIFSGVMKLLHLRLVEVVRVHTFIDVALRLGQRIPRIEHSALANEYMPELVNRFFDVVNIQKSWAKIMLEVPAALLQIVVGLFLMAVYSPYLLAFGVFTVICVAGIVVGLGYDGVRTDIAQSREKYRVAQWLEELARCETSCKMAGLPNHLLRRTDELVLDYIRARSDHFAVIFRQALGNYGFQAVAGATVFGIGGMLVIDRSLTLGQLVAAEIVVVSVLAAIEKTVVNLENYYDLVTALDKVGHVIDLPIERLSGKKVDLSPQGDGLALNCRDIHFAYFGDRPVLKGLSLYVEPGARVSLVGHSGVGKSTLTALIAGLQETNIGSISVGSADIRDLNLEYFRRQIALVNDANEIFDGSIEENITMGRDFLTHNDLVWALEVTRLDGDIRNMSEGLNTRLVSAGKNLSRGQMQRVLIARAIIEKPKLLILDEAFSGIDEDSKLAIARYMFSPEHKWTVINISHDPQLIWLTNLVHVLADGKIAETGSPEELADNSESIFSSLFSGRIVKGKRRATS